jgi:hypothetical protein
VKEDASADRSKNLAKGSKKIRDHLMDVYEHVRKGYEDQQPRANDIIDYWDMWNCVLSNEQKYNGRNRLYAPYVYEGIQARATRFVNQLFPMSDRHVEAASEDGTVPRAQISLCEHYVSDTDLREVLASLSVSGDVEGQYNIYTAWEVNNRRTVSRVEKPIEVVPGMDDPFEKVTETTPEDKPTGGPTIEVLSDRDVSILPATAASVDAALGAGGTVTILRRWSKRQIKALVKKGTLDKAAAQEVIDDIENFKDDSNTTKDPAKTALCAAGIKKDGRGKYALVYETWAELEVEEDEYRLCQVFFVGPYKILMARRNPYWCDQCPLFSAPVKRTFGSIKGTSLIAPVRKLQFFANDVLNEMADGANYTLLPITRRDPAYATSPLILAPGAIWDVPPKDADFAHMDPTWTQGQEILSSLKAEIFQVLSVNPAMVTQGTKKKQNQAEVAQEQQIDILTTSDSTRVLKDAVLNPLVNLWMDLDYQFRDYKMTIREYGEMGQRAELESVPPFQLRRKTTFFWIGDEIIRGQQQLQAKIGLFNLLMKIPPPLMPHFQLDLEPVICDIVETGFGPRISRLALKDTRALISVDPKVEDQLMDMGHYVVPHPMDDHQQHISEHMESIKATGDPKMLKQAHILDHKIAAQQQMQQQQMGMQGTPAPQAPGSGAPPGGGQPQAGAIPAQARPAQQPPGAIPPDQMGRGDPSVMPRKF